MTTMRSTSDFIRVGDMIESIDTLGESAPVIGTVTSMTLCSNSETGKTFTILYVDRIDAEAIAVFTNHKLIRKIEVSR